MKANKYFNNKFRLGNERRNFLSEMLFGILTFISFFLFKCEDKRNGINSDNTSISEYLNKISVINPMSSPYNAKFDGVTDDSLAIQNAINDLPENGLLLLPNGKDLALILSPITLKSNITLYSEGSGFKGIKTSPTNILSGTGLQNIKIKGIVVDGGAMDAATDIGSIRTIRFVNCSNIRIEECEVSHGFDWQLSFENCMDCHVRNHQSYGMGNGYPGGRDGIHFLDCDNCSVEGAYIESGDDCVGVTTKNKTSKNISIKIFLENRLLGVL